MPGMGDIALVAGSEGPSRATRVLDGQGVVFEAPNLSSFFFLFAQGESVGSRPREASKPADRSSKLNSARGFRNKLAGTRRYRQRWCKESQGRIYEGGGWLGERRPLRKHTKWRDDHRRWRGTNVTVLCERRLLGAVGYRWPRDQVRKESWQRRESWDMGGKRKDQTTETWADLADAGGG